MSLYNFYKEKKIKKKTFLQTPRMVLVVAVRIPGMICCYDVIGDWQFPLIPLWSPDPPPHAAPSQWLMAAELGGQAHCCGTALAGCVEWMTQTGDTVTLPEGCCSLISLLANPPSSPLPFIGIRKALWSDSSPWQLLISHHPQPWTPLQ